MPDPYGYQTAKEANQAIARNRDTYRYTTEPLMKINETLVEILNELRKISKAVRGE